MELRPGYKQTEIGMIPEDWEVRALGDISDIYRGASPRPIESPIWFDEKSQIGWVRISDVTKSKRRLKETTQRLSELGVRHSRFVPKDSLIMSICATVGRPVITDIDVCIHDGFVVFEKQRVLQDFLYHSLKALESDWSKSGQTGSQMNLNTGIINPTRIPFPPNQAEQEAIAEALSDTDALIESLEQLVAKKRQIKQGAMQELLSPKLGDEVQLLRDVSTLKGRIGWQGLNQTEFTSNDDEPFLITGMNFKDGAIRWNEVYHISEPRYEMAKDIQLRTGDVLMTKDGTIGKVLYIDNIPSPGKASLNSHLLLFRPIRESYNSRYLYYQLSSQRFKDFIELSKYGTTFFGISQAAVGNYPVLLPPIEDQVRIASILSDIDSEIDALETKLTKTLAIKQGMMHNLITGRIRLIRQTKSTNNKQPPTEELLCSGL
jgi:type I restriction enzyme S subunit